MDILIGTSLLIAIVLLGALITAGNERQRKALDGIREQVEAWAQEDILIKREKVARSIQVEAPLAWLEKDCSRCFGSGSGHHQFHDLGKGWAARDHRCLQ